MQITASAVSLNVADVPASAAFLTSHFGFRQDMAADGFASLAREDAGMNVVFLRRGGRKSGHGHAPRARRSTIPHRTWRHVVTERTARRWPGLKHIRRPRTRRGWLITIAVGDAILALKLTLGLSVLALVVHLLTH